MNARTVLLLFLAISAFQPPLQVNAAIDSANDPRAILATMKKVADWHLAQPSKRAVDDWTYGAFYAGVSALSQISDDSKHHDALVAMGRKQEWKPGKRVYDADDHCVTQTYLDLYLQHRDLAMLAATKSEFDSILANPKTNDLRFDVKGARERWAWCDALFMGPPAWVRLYAATSDKKYLAFVDREWRGTSDFLYDKEEHLYYRDSTYFEKREANGKKVFWSRGNGWVLAGLARVLQVMPPEHPNRKFYQQQFREMAQKIASLQQPDGLWHSSLLDPASYPLKETSGSGFYTFALAWGINRGALDRATYEPVARKAWQALLQCVNPDGKLSSVQPIGADPKTFDPENSEVFGAGAFLLAGSEMYRMALADQTAAAYAAFMPQRKDDFAWENDRIGFRVYGPALEATGEITSGLDVWVKRTRKPIIEKWFYLADYHKDHGEGLDMYKVGPSRGCGGTGIWRDGKPYVANNFITWRMLENGPSRVTFELTYAPYDAAGIKIYETKLISLETGTNLNRIENRFDWEGGPGELQAIVGIVKRPGGGPPDFARDGSWMAYWEPEQKGNGTIGCGVVMTSGAQSVDTPEQAFLQTTVKRGQPLIYYAGAGWTKSGDFPSKESWVQYLSESSGKLSAASK
jgi:rhamnogalacturonyl hydrolase YesR